jgi:hypothetical protein
MWPSIRRYVNSIRETWFPPQRQRWPKAGRRPQRVVRSPAGPDAGAGSRRRRSRQSGRRGTRPRWGPLAGTHSPWNVCGKLNRKPDVGWFEHNLGYP